MLKSNLGLSGMAWSVEVLFKGPCDGPLKRIFDVIDGSLSAVFITYLFSVLAGPVSPDQQPV